MRRMQRRTHIVMWLFLPVVLLGVLVIALSWRTVHTSEVNSEVASDAESSGATP